MNKTINGYQVKPAEVDLSESEQTGVWLVDGDNTLFRMIVGVRTQDDAARAYVKHSKGLGHTPPTVFRVFPLASLEPITLSGIVDLDGDEEWSAFNDAWVEVRL